MQWFEEWFDSPLYEQIYANRDETEADLLAELLTRLIPVQDYRNVLDLACGRGRHSINMAKRGYNVTGIDLSEESILMARSKAEKENLHRVDFLIGDMREPHPDTFDAVINLFTSFGYFGTDKQNSEVIRNVAGMLRTRGVFILDFLNAHTAKKNLVPREQGQIDNYDYEITRSIENDTVIKTIKFMLKGKAESHNFEERVKLYDKSWFEKNFRNAGLQTEHVYGDYKGAPFQVETSPRLLITARKTEI